MATHKTVIGEYVISDDRDRFDVDAFHDFIRTAYWAQGRSREATAEAVANSLVFGVYAPDGSMVGAARVVTDYATFGWISDLYVLEPHRGRGLASAMVAAMNHHPRLATLKRLVLMTDDAHGLYEQHSFGPLRDPGRWMERPGHAL